MAAQPAMGPSGPQPTRQISVVTTGCRPLLPGAACLAVAVVILGLGMMMRSDAKFADQYVARQLSEQRITFKSADALTAEERQAPCLVENAGNALTTGVQAECYANSFIARHLKGVAGGQTYSELRDVQTSLRSQIAAAQADNDPGQADLQRQLNEVTAKRQTLFEGETVRGLLLTSYGFSTLGDKAAQGSAIAFIAGGAILTMSLVLLARGVVRSRPAPVERPAATRAPATEPQPSREMRPLSGSRLPGSGRAQRPDRGYAPARRGNPPRGPARGR